jgi:hypothetical protein
VVCARALALAGTKEKWRFSPYFSPNFYSAGAFGAETEVTAAKTTTTIETDLKKKK